MSGRTIARAMKNRAGGKPSRTAGKDKQTCQATTAMRYCAANSKGYKHPEYSQVCKEWDKRNGIKRAD